MINIRVHLSLLFFLLEHSSSVNLPNTFTWRWIRGRTTTQASPRLTALISLVWVAISTTSRPPRTTSWNSINNKRERQRQRQQPEAISNIPAKEAAARRTRSFCPIPRIRTSAPNLSSSSATEATRVMMNLPTRRSTQQLQPESMEDLGVGIGRGHLRWQRLRGPRRPRYKKENLQRRPRQKADSWSRLPPLLEEKKLPWDSRQLLLRLRLSPRKLPSLTSQKRYDIKYKFSEGNTFLPVLWNVTILIQCWYGITQKNVNLKMAKIDHLSSFCCSSITYVEYFFLLVIRSLMLALQVGIGSHVYESWRDRNPSRNSV